ncbi:hypothetical protein VCRA2114E365_60142 [Vibrio crassostreae]|nr:hypothetical protein VCRA2117O378_150060 [Vibrio crassostreae]CAK2033985.1 hypothetical protein VCRA2119O381_30039 [Vibrio crassostreae]CAK2174087.1 hypothetical protein VCRA2113O363_60087 [Vibrio crassostreae]CAK2175310.1 hypothetical protein VCRA2113O362_60088 [Vibrio crassostreae]CAK2177467.1 hypothetical protein VCRA2113O357_60142 [Vibrio crassostreae]
MLKTKNLHPLGYAGFYYVFKKDIEAELYSTYFILEIIGVAARQPFPYKGMKFIPMSIGVLCA